MKSNYPRQCETGFQDTLQNRKYTYRVTVTGDNGDVVFNQDVEDSPSETLTNLTENIQYNVTVYVRVTEDVSCLSSESVIVTSKRNVHAFSIINYRSMYFLFCRVS